jgi:tetratricopeptide (TPR) repeat protein
MPPRNALSAADSQLKNQAKQLEYQGKWDDAFAIYKELLQRNRDDYGILLSLSIAYSKAGRVEQAREEFQRALKIYQNDRQFMLSYARFLADNNILQEAESAFTRALSIYKNDKELMLGLARCLQKQNKQTEAIKTYEAALAIPKEDRHDLDLWIGMARCLEEMHHYQIALEVLDSVPSKYSEDRNLIAAKIYCKKLMGDTQGAIALSRSAMDMDRPDPKIILPQVRSLQENQQYNAALAILNNQAVSSLHNRELMLAKCYILIDAGYLEQAMEAFDDSLRYFPDDSDILIGKANCLTDKEEFPKALAILDSMLGQPKYQHERKKILAQKFRCLILQKNYDLALTFYNENLKPYENDLDIVMLYGHYLENKGDYCAALKLYETQSLNHPNESKLLVSKARCLQKTGQSAAANKIFSEDLAKTQDKAVILKHAHFLRTKGEFSGSIKILDEYLATHQDDMEVLFNKANCLVETGNLQAAREIFSRIYAVDDNKDVVLSYSLVLEKQRDCIFLPHSINNSYNTRSIIPI